MAGISSANKNATAVERALANDALSGKKCSKCGKDIKRKDLLSVKAVAMESGSSSMTAYHRNCYSF